ncbi:hypothetical protein HDU91_001688 [Kappamyces sp. JEL0680]|nr:hypothetical protein HDU91_001688 [Kappamyces sp. JEL0680]
MFAEPAKSIAVPVTINSTTPSGKVIVDTFQVGFSTTASSLIEHYFQNGMIPDRNFSLFEELCRTLPLESLLQRQMVIQTAEDDAINAVGKRVDHQKKLLIKRMQELNARDYSTH